MGFSWYLLMVLGTCTLFCSAAAPPALSADFDLLQNASFFQYVAGADGWMMGTGHVHTANLMGLGVYTHWWCWGVAPAQGSVLVRYDLNASWYINHLAGTCFRIPPDPPVQPDPWQWLRGGNVRYVGRGVAPCGPSDTWATTTPANFSAVSVCVGKPTVPVYAARYTSVYFTGGNVLNYTSSVNKRLFDVPCACAPSPHCTSGQGLV